LNGYFAKLKREIRLRIPGSVIFRKVFTLQIKYRAKDLVPESLNELAWVKNEFPSKVPSKSKLVMGIPKLETRGDKWVEGDHFFVMSHQEVFSPLLDFESVLVLSGSPFSHLEPGLRDIYEDHMSNPEKRVILIHGDIRYTKPGELESWMEKVHLVVHFNPLYASKVQKHYPKKPCQILIWPSLPFPESFFGEIVAKTRKERGQESRTFKVARIVDYQRLIFRTVGVGAPIHSWIIALTWRGLHLLNWHLQMVIRIVGNQLWLVELSNQSCLKPHSYMKADHGLIIS
jgi:hypothetical protein